MSVRDGDSNVVSLHTRTTYQPNYGALARSRVVAARRQLGLSATEFGELLAPLLGHPVAPETVEAWETYSTPPGDVLLAAGTVSPATSDRIGLRSHKFIAGHIGSEAARRLLETQANEHPQPMSPWGDGVIPLEPQSENCQLHVWPFGSAVFHLVEELDLPDITSLALWRYRTYGDNLAWASERLRTLTGDRTAGASYVLSLYWLHTASWVGQMLDTALKIVCAPRVLLDREMADAEASQCAAEQAERTLLAEGYDNDEMRPFGQKGVAIGYASWSGVVYHPLHPSRALAERELVSCELATQAIWAYCESINNQVEEGHEPTYDSRFGWRFLRGAKSRLMNPRSKESGQHRSMRDAVLDTSGLMGHIGQAIDALRDIEER